MVWSITWKMLFSLIPFQHEIIMPVEEYESLKEVGPFHFSQIHRSRKVNSAEPQDVRESNFYSERLSVECLTKIW